MSYFNTNLSVVCVKLALAATFIISTTNLVQAKNTDNNREGHHQRPTFESIDLNENGEINLEEFSSHKIPHGDHETVFNYIDTDGDGIITNEEFVNHKPPQREGRRGERS